MTDWKEDTISECISINPKRELKKNSVAKYVSMADITANQKSVTYYVERKFYGGSKFQNGDTLLARISPCLENGKTAYVDFLKNGEIAWGSTEFIVLSGKDGKSINEFVYYLAKSSALRNVAIRSMSGTSGRQRVQEQLLANEKIAIPPLIEQRSIVKLLSDLDAKIELNHQMNKTIEETAQAIFKHWFVDFEFPDESDKPYKSNGGKLVDSEFGKIPVGWKSENLDKIADYLNGLALQKFPPTGDNDLPVIKIRELRQGTVDGSDMANNKLRIEYVIDDGDVLFSWSGSLEIRIWCGGRGALNQHLFKVTSKKYPKWFFLYWTLFYLPSFQKIAEGKATTMGHIQRHHLTGATVALPPEALIQKADKILTPLIETFIINSVESRKLGSTRDSLLPRIMSGTIRVT